MWTIPWKLAGLRRKSDNFWEFDFWEFPTRNCNQLGEKTSGEFHWEKNTSGPVEANLYKYLERVIVDNLLDRNAGEDIDESSIFSFFSLKSLSSITMLGKVSKISPQ